MDSESELARRYSDLTMIIRSNKPATDISRDNKAIS